MEIINVREDEQVFLEVLKCVSQNPMMKMDLCSGYLNLMKSYVTPHIGKLSPDKFNRVY